MNDKSITLPAGEHFICGTAHEGITHVAIFELPGKGLMPGEWDFLINKLSSSGSQLANEKDVLLRICLIKKTTWEDILKAIPKGSLIKDFRRVR